MAPKQVHDLLNELCVDLGFCLPLKAQSDLAKKPPADIEAFVDAVIRAEGLELHEVSKPLRADLRARVAKYFAGQEGSSS